MNGRRLPRVLLLLVSAAACGGEPPLPPPPPAPPPVPSWPPLVVAAPVRQTPDAPFRDNPPEPGPPVAWTPPDIQSWSLPNGVRVLFVERHDLPIVSVRVVSSVGAGDRPDARPGATVFMGAMLEQGAGKRGALAISDDYEALGADHGTWCEWDSCVVRAKVMASRLKPALDLVADIVLKPTFPDAEVERQRKRWMASLQQEKNSPPTMEQNAVAAVVFGPQHPYGRGMRGRPADVEKLKRDEVVAEWRRAIAPSDTTIAVAGDVAPAELREMLKERFGGWYGAAAESAAVVRARVVKGGPRVVLVDVPGAAQSQVYLAEEGPAFATPDRIALGVMNAILGGMFSSRINLDLREAHAYTYGAHSRFSMRHGAGPFVAGGAIFAQHTGDALKALLAHVARIRDEPVTPEELADAKENARLALPARFEAVDDVTGALQDLAVYKLPKDEYAKRAARIDAVTAADVQRVARQWLHPDAVRIVVTGDRARIEKELAALGLGAIELRDAYGEVVK
ncbi:MAG: M16 family metallopeptidase [Polyangiaceae bacterium]